MGRIRAFFQADRDYFRDCRAYIARQNSNVLKGSCMLYLLVLLLYAAHALWTSISSLQAAICGVFGVLQIALTIVVCFPAGKRIGKRRMERYILFFEVTVLGFFLLESLFPIRDQVSVYFPFPILLLVIMFTCRPRRVFIMAGIYILLFSAAVCAFKTGSARDGDLWMAGATLIASLAGYLIVASLRHETGAALRFRAERDPLTGLYNRDGFCAKAADMILSKPAGFYVVACLDIASFKVVNDQYGLARGDALLKHVGNTLQTGFAAIGGIACRVMADKFAVLYPKRYLDSAETEEIRMNAAAFGETDVPVGFSIGRYIADDLTLSVSAMYDRAAIAETSVKGRADVRIALYDESMRERLLREQEISNDMEPALENGDFEVWFQPQYNHATGALIGAEALVRWQHPDKGLIPPDAFIPVFENNGFIYQLDQYVWKQVCLHLRRWLDAGRAPLPVSVNISRYDIFRPDFLSVITGLTETYRIPVGLLRLEITESAFAQSTEQIIQVVRQLIDYGFTMEIDDFGSGYSSLNTLKDVPAHVLKLDMRFLENTADSSRGGNVL